MQENTKPIYIQQIQEQSPSISVDGDTIVWGGSVYFWQPQGVMSGLYVGLGLGNDPTVYVWAVLPSPTMYTFRRDELASHPDGAIALHAQHLVGSIQSLQNVLDSFNYDQTKTIPSLDGARKIIEKLKTELADLNKGRQAKVPPPA